MVSRASGHELCNKFDTATQRLEWTCSSAVERRDSLYKTLTSCIIKRHNLRKVNCINDCFYIWHSGHSSRINSFRLGRLPFQQVDLHEVNAALGEVVRLLSALQFKSPRFQLIHMGSYSKIQCEKCCQSFAECIICSDIGSKNCIQPIHRR